MGTSVLSGPIPADGIVSLLRDIEERRTTGVIRFVGDGVEGEVVLVGGQIAMEQEELADGTDPLDRLLELRGGRYEVIQRLPPLPVSYGDDRMKKGSLAVHVPADLMKYCERAGLTGRLRLVRQEHVAEAMYDRGDLVGIQLDGSAEEDLAAVFGWDEGEFVLEAMGSAPRLHDEPSELPAAAAGDEPFLKVVEVALAHIVEERENRRPAKASPVTEPPPRTRPSTRPPPGPGPTSVRAPTVKVVYLRPKEKVEGDGESETRHVRADITATFDLPDAAPQRLPRDGKTSSPRMPAVHGGGPARAEKVAEHVIKAPGAERAAAPARAESARKVESAGRAGAAPARPSAVRAAGPVAAEPRGSADVDDRPVARSQSDGSDDEEHDMARKRRKGGKGKAAQRAGAASEVRSKQAAERSGAASEARSKRDAERSDRDRAEEIEEGAELDGAAADSTTVPTERPAAGPPSMRAVLHAFAWVGVVIILGLGGIALLSVLPQLE